MLTNKTNLMENNLIKEKRIGKISMTIELLENSKLTRLIFKHFAPHYIENDQFLGRLTYIGYSKYFDPKDEGAIVPSYDVSVHSYERGPDSIEFNKID